MAEIYENLMSGVTPALSDSVRVVTSDDESNKALLSAIAKLIVESYEGTSLTTTSQNIQDAINELESGKVSMNFNGSVLEIG